VTGKLLFMTQKSGSIPVDLPLELVLGKKPQKQFIDNHNTVELKPLILPKELTVMDDLDRVLHLVSVGSKRQFRSEMQWSFYEVAIH